MKHVFQKGAQIVNYKHGGRQLAEYGIWARMRQRITNSNHKFYHRYGGRGIRVCSEWEQFSTFLQDMGLRPTISHSLERKDNDGPYSKGNCIWASRQTQANNRSTNHVLTYAGRTQSIAAWERELGFSHVISDRLRRGWTIERTLTRPVFSAGK